MSGKNQRNGGGTRAERGRAVRRRILEVYEQHERRDGCPPTVREVARELGVTSTAHVSYHLDKLEEDGLLTRAPGTARGRHLAQRPGVPVFGRIAAGLPLDIFDPGDRDVLDLGQHLREERAERAQFALLVRGDSMIEDHINDGDYVFVRPGVDAEDGAVVVALHRAEGGERGAATIKRFYRDRDHQEVRLVPANATLATRVIPAAEWDREWEVQGTVTGVYRPMIALLPVGRARAR